MQFVLFVNNPPKFSTSNDILHKGKMNNSVYKRKNIHNFANIFLLMRIFIKCVGFCLEKSEKRIAY